MYKIPVSKRTVKANRFPFEVDGEQYSIPLLKFLPIAAVEALEDGQQVKPLLLACDTPGAKDALRGLDGEQLDGLVDAWQKASGITTGESEASLIS